jgi:dynein heavy chain, axonemal
VAEAKETEKMIMVARDRYRGVAARGAMLFFLLNSLNKIHAFYQFSLNAFVAVFARGIDNAPFGRKNKGEVAIDEATEQPVRPPIRTINTVKMCGASSSACNIYPFRVN